MPAPHKMAPEYEPSFSIFNHDNPTSLINVCPKTMVNVLGEIEKAMPRMLLWSESELRKKCDVDERDERLRLQFWDEYNLATAQNRRMTLHGFIDGVTTHEIFVKFYLKRRMKMIWIITPPRNYATAMKNILDHGLTRMMEIMRLPIIDPQTQQPNLKVISQIVKTFQIVDLRVKGAIIQRVQQSNVNFNADVSEAAAAQLADMSLEQLEQLEQKLDKVERLEAKMVNALPPAEREEIIEMKREMTDTSPYEKEPKADKDHDAETHYKSAGDLGAP